MCGRNVYELRLAHRVAEMRYAGSKNFRVVEDQHARFTHARGSEFRVSLRQCGDEDVLVVCVQAIAPGSPGSSLARDGVMGRSSRTHRAENQRTGSPATTSGGPTDVVGKRHKYHGPSFLGPPFYKDGCPPRGTWGLPLYRRDGKRSAEFAQIPVCRYADAACPKHVRDGGNNRGGRRAAPKRQNSATAVSIRFKTATRRDSGLLNKRAFDVAFALVALTISLPLMSVAVVLIALLDRQLPFYLDERVGLSGKRFNCWKLRTMRSDPRVLEAFFEEHPQTREQYRTTRKLETETAQAGSRRFPAKVQPR